MSMNLHPVGFVETAGGCEGPRYTRSQPSRETAGVLLNECESKYVSKFDLPYRNIARYISELEQSWNKISEKDKEMVTKNLVKNVPSLRSDLINQAASPNILSFLKDYVSLDPENNTKELLNAMYKPSDTIKSVVSDSKMNSIQKAFDSWSGKQSISFHINMKTVMLTLFMLVLFFVLGVASCKGVIKK